MCKLRGRKRISQTFLIIADTQAEFEKAMDWTLSHAKNTFCFLDDKLKDLKGNKNEHHKLVVDLLGKLKQETGALKISNCALFENEVIWLGHNPSESEVILKITIAETILI